MARLLFVDDEPNVLFTLSELFEAHAITTAASAEEAMDKLDGADLVITDLAMPGKSGLDLLAAARAKDPSLPVILLTARGSERIAVRAMKEGAFDYVTKPFDVDEMLLLVDRALELRALRRRERRLLAERALGRPLVGTAPAFTRVLDAVSRVADRDVPVLVLGETGTGKELVAGLLHAESRRAAAPLVRFNCAAIPAELAEAELFGHTKGAFTGAASARRGYFAEAHGGTLVLDEIGELPLGVQAKLLRAVQEGEIQPVGAGRVEHVDVRVVACTHRDLLAEARAGRFREDLYYRLAVVELRVPPLRDRREDIPLLAEEFARKCARRFGLDGVRLAPALLDALTRCPWPGNVRELENTVARLVALSTGGTIDASALTSSSTSPSAPSSTSEAAAPRATGTFREQVAAFERDLLARALDAARGNQSEAARRLGMSRVTLIDRLKRHGLA